MSLWTSQAIPSLNHWQWYYLIIYGCLGVASGIVAFIRNSLFFVDGVIAASRLHSKSFRRVMRAPMWFFDVNINLEIFNSYFSLHLLEDSSTVFQKIKKYWILP